MATKPKSKVFSTTPEYQVIKGRVAPNKAATAVVKKYTHAKKAQAAVDATYVGARLLSLFVRYPWLQSLDLHLTAEGQGDDQGGMFRSISSSVESVGVVEGSSLPEDISDDKGAFDQALALGVLDQDVDEHDLASEIYTSIFEPWDYDDIKISLDRSKVADLLQSSPMSGRQAFKALLPQHVHLLGEKSVVVDADVF